MRERVNLNIHYYDNDLTNQQVSAAQNINAKPIEHLPDIEFIHHKQHGIDFIQSPADVNAGDLLVVHPGWMGSGDHPLSKQQMQYLRYFHPQHDILWSNAPGVGQTKLAKGQVYTDVLGQSLKEIAINKDYSSIKVVAWSMGAVALADVLANSVTNDLPVEKLVLWDPPMTRKLGGLAYGFVIEEGIQRSGQYNQDPQINKSTIELVKNKVEVNDWKPLVLNQLLMMSRGAEYWQNKAPAIKAKEILVVHPELTALNPTDDFEQIAKNMEAPLGVILRVLMSSSHALQNSDSEKFTRSLLDDPNQQ